MAVAHHQVVFPEQALVHLEAAHADRAVSRRQVHAAHQAEVSHVGDQRLVGMAGVGIELLLEVSIKLHIFAVALGIGRVPLGR